MMTEWEELLTLRKLVEEQRTAIAEKEKIIAEKDDLIRRKDIQIENMIQALLHARKKMFGPSTEATVMKGQMHLFETMPELAEHLQAEQKKISVKEHKRIPRQPGVREAMLAGLPKEVEEYIISPEDTCTKCGAPLKVIGREIVRTEVEYRPAHLLVKQIVRQVAKCTRCGSEGSENPCDHIQKAAVPANVLPHSLVTPTLAAHILYGKFAMGIPLSRQESDLYRMGLAVGKATMAHWVIRCSEEWLEPVYWRVHAELLKCGVLHMDETRIQCNKEPGKKASSDSWMWVIQSGARESLKATFFYYSRTRSGDVPKQLLEGFHGYLVTDAYQGYEKVEGIKRSLCWSHAKRYYLESIPLDQNGKEIPGSKGAEAREYIDLLFQLEKEMKELSPKERKEKRQTASRAVLDAFWAWHEKTSAMYTTNEELTKALAYTANQRKGLEMFLEDGRLEISNNLCESHIRPFAAARRAWLFADTPKGAAANAVLYTLVETARANELDLYEYLCYLLRELPNTDFQNKPEKLDKLLPWSEELPEKCRLVKRRKTVVKSVAATE